MRLEEFFARHNKLALAFSGGTDSAYLLYMAKHCGADVRPYFMQTAFQPAFERRDAERLAKELDVRLTVLNDDVLQDADIATNSALRCYYCKKRLFSQLISQAAEDGYTLLADGTNASDDAEDRPGMRALQELGVVSPLRVCGLSKREIIAASREAGLFTWEKPAYACLATRIPTGTVLRAEDLSRAERGEKDLAELGFHDFRLRVLGRAAKLQLRDEQFIKALALRQEIMDRLRMDFDEVLLDLKGREAKT